MAITVMSSVAVPRVSSSFFRRNMVLLFAMTVLGCFWSSLLSRPVDAMTIKEALRTLPELSESARFMERSSVLDDMETDVYGSEITVMLPSNEAWQKVSDERKEYLLNPDNIEDLETLILFATTDLALREADIGGTTQQLVTLLGVDAEISPEGRVCVLSMYTGEPYQCATVTTWDIAVKEGYIHLVSEALFPEELFEVFEQQQI